MTTTLVGIDDNGILPPNYTYCREMLAPWVIESLPVDGDRAQKIIRGEGRRFRKKLLIRFLKAASGRGRLVSSYRTPQHVKSAYERIWTTYRWPTTDPSVREPNPTYAVWENELLVLRKGGLDQMEIDRICSAIETIKPKSVLEIGCGVGRNLFVLSVMYPDIRFAGYELSAAGVAVARSVQTEAKLPDVIAQFCPRRIADLKAHTRIEFNQGDASGLPVPDKAFDVVFTRLALEQMEACKSEVLAEISRISRLASIHVEPFNNSNRSTFLKRVKKVKNHFSLNVEELIKYGLQPNAYFDSWPQKLKMGVGLTVAQPIDALS